MIYVDVVVIVSMLGWLLLCVLFGYGWRDNNKVRFY